MSLGGRGLLAPLCVGAVVTSVGVWLLWVTYNNTRPDVQSPRPPTYHLPTQCHKYLNDGTDNWKTCMGVGMR